MVQCTPNVYSALYRVCLDINHHHMHTQTHVCMRAVHSGDDDTVDDDLWNGYFNCDEHTNVCQNATAMYLFLSCCYAVLLIAGIILLRNPPKVCRPAT